MRKHRPVRWSAVAVIAALLSATAVVALASTLPDEPPPALDTPAESLEADHPDVPLGFDRRNEAIEASLHSRKAPIWAGKYYEGDGLGANIQLSLSPDAGATVTWHGCMGLYGANHGALVESPDGALRIDFVAPNEPDKFANFPSELVPVSWGERQYLIPPDKIPEFVSAINHGREPRKNVHGRFLLRDGDEARPVTGLPSLPTSIPAQVRHEPVEVEVESVELRSRKEEDGYCSIRYVLRVVPVSGAIPPLFVGEDLRALGNEYTGAEVTVLHGASADAELSSSECDGARAPKPGDKFTTGAYKEEQGDDDE